MTYEDRIKTIQEDLITRLNEGILIPQDIKLAIKKVREAQIDEMYENIHKETANDELPF